MGGYQTSATVTLSGQISKPLERLIEVMNLLSEILHIPGMKTEMRYLLRLQSFEEKEINKSFKLGLVETRIGGTEDTNDIVI